MQAIIQAGIKSQKIFAPCWKFLFMMMTKTLGLYVGPTVRTGTAGCADFGRGVRCQRWSVALMHGATKVQSMAETFALFDEWGLLNHAPILSSFREVF
jgi:hypothetical protein